MEHDTPWARMITSKYLTPSRLTPKGKKLPCSRVWAACKLGGPIFNQGIKWSIRNGRSTLFWWDFWLSSGTCRSLILGPLTAAELSLTIADVYKIGEGWLLEKLSFALPDQIILEMNAIPFSINSNAEDGILWAFSPTGNFSLQSAYLLSKG